MSTRGNYTGAHVRSLSPHTCPERGVSGQFELFLWDAAAVLGASLLVSATGVGIAFAVFVLLFCAV